MYIRLSTTITATRRKLGWGLWEKNPSKNKWCLWASSERNEDDADFATDAILWVFSDPVATDHVVASPCRIPEVRTKLVEHLLPTQDILVKKILEPLKATVSDLEGKLAVLDHRNNLLLYKYEAVYAARNIYFFHFMSYNSKQKPRGA